MKKKNIIIGVIALIIIAGIIGAMQNNNKDKISVKQAESDKKSTKKEESKKADYEITDVKVEKDVVASYVTGVLKNNTNANKKYISIKFAVKDKSGNKVGDAFANVNDIESNGTWKFKAIYMGSEKNVVFDLQNPKVTGF